MKNKPAVIPAGEPDLELVQRVIKELTSDRAPTPSVTGAACKEITGISLVTTRFNASSGDIYATIDVNADQTDPHGYSGSTHRSFVLSRADVRCLGNEAPKYASSFSLIADQMDEERSELAGISAAALAEEASASPQAVTGTSRGLPRVKSIKFV